MKKQDKQLKKKIARLDNRLGRIRNKLDREQEYSEIEYKVRSELGLPDNARITLG